MILIVVFFSITQTSQPPTTSIPGFLTRHTEVDVELIFLSEMIAKMKINLLCRTRTRVKDLKKNKNA